MKENNLPEQNGDTSAQAAENNVSAFKEPASLGAEGIMGLKKEQVSENTAETDGLEEARGVSEGADGPEKSGRETKSAEEESAPADEIQEIELQDGEKGPVEIKKAPPKVSPSTMVLTFIFALVFCAAAYFFPYIEALMPWGGDTIKGGLVVEEYTYQQLIEKAHFVIVGEVGEKRDNIIQYRPTSDGLDYIIYSEVDIKVQEVLLGEPYIDEDGVLTTYELGGRREIKENGRPHIIKIEYDGAAELAAGERVILFLDDQNNILGEKYGVYRRHSDNYYYDERQAVYSIDGIRSDLSLRQD